MDDNICTYVFDLDSEIEGRLWNYVSTVADPDDFFYAVFANGYHNEPYYLDTIFENRCEDTRAEHDEMLCVWIDMFYDQWTTIIEQMAKRRMFNLYKCHVDLKNKTLYVVLQRRNQDEAFVPSFRNR